MSTTVNLYVFIVIFIGIASQEIYAYNYRVCTVPTEQVCSAIEIGNSNVTCTQVANNIECAVKLKDGLADFAAFTEEELLLISQQQPNLLHVIASVKHNTKVYDPYAFEAVAVVKSSHTGGIDGLKGKGFCHPGFDVFEQRWSSRVLKYFEKKVAVSSSQCSGNKSPAASDAEAISNFFGSACRPGRWSFDDEEDAALKTKYPNLCQACSNTGNTSCAYDYAGAVPLVVEAVNPHRDALQCLQLGRGNVSYVAWAHAKTFLLPLVNSSEYGLLCENGTVVPLTSTILQSATAPCSWVRQPWPAVVATKAKSEDLLRELSIWIPASSTTAPNIWQETLMKILYKSDSSARLVYPANVTTTNEYVTSARPLPTSNTCGQEQKWCTISDEEQLKCDWLGAAAYSLGVEPTFSCVKSTNGVFGCLVDIQQSKADLFMADTNYGYLARKHYKLAAALYAQTARAASSRVVAVINNSSATSITSFSNLSNKIACFPEYGGIAWISFANVACERKVMAEEHFNYPKRIGEFFNSACAPGADYEDHSLNAANTGNICSVCRVNPLVVVNATGNESTCAANYTNQYFGVNGTLACLAANHTDVAFFDAQHVTASMIITAGLTDNSLRVLCRNGSLALNTGLDVNDDCLLSYTVDAEILARPNYDGLRSLRSMLFQLDALFGSFVNEKTQIVGFKMYSTFNSLPNLLFKESITSLANASSDTIIIKNYVELYKHLDEKCSANIYLPSILTVIAFSLFALLFQY